MFSANLVRFMIPHRWMLLSNRYRKHISTVFWKGTLGQGKIGPSLPTPQLLEENVQAVGFDVNVILIQNGGSTFV